MSQIKMTKGATTVKIMPSDIDRFEKMGYVRSDSLTDAQADEPAPVPETSTDGDDKAELED